MFASASCLRVKTGALNRSATSPYSLVPTRRAMRALRRFDSGHPALRPSGHRLAPMFASASCLRVKTGALNRSATSPYSLVPTRRAMRALRRFDSGHPALRPSGHRLAPMFASASCLRVKTGALNRSATSPYSLAPTRRAMRALRRFDSGHPALLLHMTLQPLPLRAGGGWEGVASYLGHKLSALRCNPSSVLPCKQGRRPDPHFNGTRRPDATLSGAYCSRSSPPMYGRSTSGTSMLPSACW